MKRLMFLAMSASLLASGVSAQTRPLESGRTAVALSSGFLSAATALGITITPVLPAQVFEGVASFPINGGTLDLGNARGEIDHPGGLQLTTATTRVQLLNFIIETTAAPKLTGMVVVNGRVVGRVHLFDLVLPGALTLPLVPDNDLLTLVNVGVRLSEAAASALNSIFNVTAFRPGLEIGTARVSAFTGRRVF